MRRSIVLVSAVLATLLGVLAGPASAATKTAGSPAGTAPFTVGTSAGWGGVTLITGDGVRLVRTAAGRTMVQTVPALRSGPGAALQTLRTPTKTYVIPISARPYLGRFLDLSLFDVGALSAASTHQRIPVRLAFTGRRAPAVPGVTITSRLAGAAGGYLTPASARRFGAALAAQYRTDSAAGFPARSSLFGATRIAAANAAPPAATPQYPMRTLIIKALDRSGRPARLAFLTVYNSDNFGKYIGFPVVIRGEARISVPLGHYTIDYTSASLSRANIFTFYDVVTNNVGVSRQNQVATVDARRATSLLSVRTPRPATQESVVLNTTQTDSHGGEFFSGIGIFGEGRVYVAPTGSPRGGTLTSSASWDLTGSPTSGTPYVYALYFPDKQGIPADESYSVRTPQLATFADRFYVDLVPRDGAIIAVPTTAGFAGSVPVSLPANLNIFALASPGAAWLTTLFASPDNFENPFAGELDDAPRLAPAGSTISADWGRGPALPNVPVDTDGAQALFGFECLACRTSSAMVLALNFATDQTPGHVWAVFASADGTPVARLRLYRNGSLIRDQRDNNLAVARVPAKKGIYRLLDQVNRGPSLALQSVQISTDITFVSTGGKGGSLPSTWSCPLGRRCTVLPLLRTSVALPTDLRGNVALGRSTIRLTVGHIQGAPAARVTSGIVQVRRAGDAWQTLSSTSLGKGSYAARLTTTRADAGSPYDIRIVATDAAGGRIVQTASRAFTVATS